MTDRSIPRIETERLVLRRPELRDFDAMLVFGQSERTRFTGGKATRWDVWRGFLAGLGHWTLRGHGFWSVDRSDTGDMVGRVGVVFHDGWDEPELGWQLYDGHEGKGYALEAGRAARHHYHSAISDRPLVSYIHADNTRSRALAGRLGAAFERQGAILGTPCEIWRHPRPEAAA